MSEIKAEAIRHIGDRQIVVIIEDGHYTRPAKGGDAKVPVTAGEIVLADRAGRFLCGPINLNGALEIAEGVVSGEAAAITHPLSMLALATALLAFTMPNGKDGGSDV